MSFLIDPPLLVASGAAIERVADDDAAAARLEMLTIAGFLATSISLYLNASWTRWIATMCGADSGRDWMINSGVFDMEHQKVGRRTHLASAAIFATYPLWLRLGRRLGSRS
ncbi:MAG: hypothetical protein ACRDLB_11640 [Actinomycetota bacterium]